MESDQYIHIKGARVNNLKNVELKIPRNQFIVVTGVSGSGKSSLAFDTLYAEGQRRYVESLSAYARQFLGRMNKPEVDFIRGIPPAIAIEQKVNTRNPRSTVGTSTEIYEYLKLLFARIGRTYSPVSGKEVRRDHVTDVVNYILSHEDSTRVVILSPLIVKKDRTIKEEVDLLQQQGFSRLEVDGQILSIDKLDVTILTRKNKLALVIDRLTVGHDEDSASRIADSVQTAFYEGHGKCFVQIMGEVPETEHFSNLFERDGIAFEEPSPLLFSFNNPLGACPKCEGYGKVIGIDEDLVIPNKSLSVYQDAVACWRGEKMQEWKNELIYSADRFGFPIHKSIYDLTEEEKALLWTGNEYFKGLNAFFQYLEENTYKIQYRVMLSRYRGKTVCPECHGARLRKEASYVKVGGKSIQELVLLPVVVLKTFFEELKLKGYELKVAERLLHEINNRIDFLCDVGLGYLTLNRLSSTLSGGESQRINLATSLGSSLVGSLYILDEPSIGLHSRDTERLINVIRKLQALGNTVLVVEHDEEIMRSADQIIDVGPGAGQHGGRVIFQGPYKELNGHSESLTAQYLTGKMKIPVPERRRTWHNYIEIKGARENNLKNINVKIPLNILTVISGVSGSGKSSLVKTILYPALVKYYGGYGEKTGIHDKIEGDLHLLKGVEFVDQNPIGKSSRSNPVTYLKAWDDIRELYSQQPAAKYFGFKPAHFSFNVEGGRCEECQGEGFIKVEMQFMADITLECESCHGKRFKEEVLNVTYHGKNIYDILNMTVNEAIDFFSAGKEKAAEKAVRKLKPLLDVGLDYVKLGQSSSTLSGGESQRIKLASFLAKETDESTLFIFDEPTTGLHFHDINKLLSSFNALIERGHSIVIIEHNLDIIKTADWVIDLGPEGGDQGGYLVAEGTPEKIAACEKSYTGHYLKEKL